MRDFIPIVALAAGALWASYTDIRHRRLSNLLALILLIAGLLFAAVTGGMITFTYHLGHAAIALCGGLGLYALGWLGAGDAKYYAGTAAWFPLAMGAHLFVWVAMSGLIVVAGWFALRRMSGKNRPKGVVTDADRVPYGVAIALGGVGLAASVLA